jgi:RTX calcium-binding nonapeptide repeat (4 copies)/WD40-like Beta Propeller Repeat
VLMLAGGSAEPGRAGCSPSYTIGDHAPVWSPTGEWIVFDRHDIGCGMPAFMTAIRADGTAEKRLSLFGRQRLEWTRDGAALLGLGLTLVAPDGRVLREPQQPGPDQGVHPSFSPDGSEIVFAAGLPSHLYVVSAAGGARRALTTGAGEARPVWSPRGDLIAFAVTGGLDVVRPDGTGRRAVWRGDTDESGFSWSPDGSRLAFLRSSDPRYVPDLLRVVDVDVDDGGGRDLARGPFLEHAPAWRPDGSAIAVTRRSADTFDVVVVRTDGAGEHAFGPGGELTWSPDGSRVAFVWHGRCPATRLGLYVAAADGSGARRLTNDCRFEGGPGADILRGTPDDDFLFGRAGSDELVDGFGEDLLEGGDGDDRLAGGEEADVLSGGRGDDVVRGGGGRDRIYGGPGRDRIEAGIAKDVIYVADGERDVVACGPQLDLVVADRLDGIGSGCELVRIARR